MSEINPTATTTSPEQTTGGWDWRARLQSVWQRATKDRQTLRATLVYTLLYISFVLVSGRTAWLWVTKGGQWWPAVVVIAANVVVTVFYLVTVLFQRWRSAKEWVIQRSVAFVTLLAMIVLAVGFVLWLWVNFFWAADDRLISSGQTEIPLAGSTATVAVSATYPNVALVDAADAELRLAFSVPQGGELPSMSLLATIRPGEHLTFPKATGVDERTFVVNIGPHGANTATIDLVNAQSYDGLRDGDAIEIDLSDPAGTKMGQTMTVDVLAEGRRGFALRRFITDTVNDNSPYIFLLLLIAPGLAALTQRTIDQRYAELKARQREEYGRLVELCRAQFRARNLLGVESVLKDMARPQYEELRGDTLGLARDSLRFARLDYDLPTKLPPAPATAGEWDMALESWPDRRLMAMAGRWREEFVAAWLEAKRNQAAYHDRLKQSLSPADAHAETELARRMRGFLDEGKDKIGSWDLAALEDRTLVDAFNAQVASDIDRGRDSDNALSGVEGSSLIIPFAHHDARDEDEARFLRDEAGSQEDGPNAKKDGAFLGRHPLWLSFLTNAARSIIIYGEEGCGRTAGAIWCEYSQDGQFARLLRVRLTSRPDMNTICAAVLETLFARLCAKPDGLALLNTGQQELLAYLLRAHLSYGWLLFHIEQSQKQRQQDASLRLERFKRIIQTQTNRPEQLAAVRAGKWGSPTGAYRSIAEIVYQLDYDGIVLIYDAAKPNAKDTKDKDWLCEKVFARLEQWHATNTYFYVFAPQTLYDELTGMTLPVNLQKETLSWTQKQLRELIVWRYGNFLWRSGVVVKDDHTNRFSDILLLERFGDEPEQFERLLRASKRPSKGPKDTDPEDTSPKDEDYSPRTFMRLWQTAVEKRPLHAVITAADVDRAFAEHGVSDS